MFSGSCPAWLARPASSKLHLVHRPHSGSSRFLFWNKIPFNSNSALLKPEIFGDKEKKTFVFVFQKRSLKISANLYLPQPLRCESQFFFFFSPPRRKELINYRRSNDRLICSGVWLQASGEAMHYLPVQRKSGESSWLKFMEIYGSFLSFNCLLLSGQSGEAHGVLWPAWVLWRRRCSYRWIRPKYHPLKPVTETNGVRERSPNRWPTKTKTKAARRCLATAAGWDFNLAFTEKKRRIMRALAEPLTIYCWKAQQWSWEGKKHLISQHSFHNDKPK